MAARNEFEGDIGGGPGFNADELDAACVTRQMLAEAGAEMLERFGADLMEIMRRKTGPNPTRPELPEIFGIGGFCELTTVRLDSVSTRKFKEWPEDQMGQKD